MTNIIKKVLLFTFLVLSLFLQLNAQDDERMSAAIYPFDYSSGGVVNQNYVASVTQTVASAFQQHGRFNLVDRTNISALEAEKELTRGIEFIEGKTLSQQSAIGAEYIITGNIDKLMIDRKVEKEGIRYQANISFLLKVTKTETGEILASKQLSSTNKLMGSMMNSGDSEEAAVEKALRKFDKRISQFINENFKGAGVYVIEALDANSNSAEKVLISGGSNMGLKKGMKLIVYIPTIKKIGSKQKTWEKQVGELKVDSIEDDAFSICSVKDGGKAILSSLQNDKELHVKIKAKKMPSLLSN